MVTHPITKQATSCLTSLIWPFTLTALIVGSCLCCALIEASKLEILYPFEKKVKVHCSSILEMDAQYKHDSKVKAVRVTGQITEVKQLVAWWDRWPFRIHTFCQILLITCSFAKT